MIRADFFANADGALLGFSVLGHSGLAQEGEDARTCRSLFEGFKLHLLGLEEQYPENLQVRYAEV